MVVGSTLGDQPARADGDRPRLAYEASLDGLRGIAILAVVAYHAFARTGHPGWVRGGYAGVSVFFTLSGFLITSLLLVEREHAGRVDLGRFVSRRIRRLSPALLVTVLGVIVLSAADVLSAHASDAAAAAWSVTNWHVIAGGEGQLLRTIVGPLGPTWSLGVEEQLYVVLVAGVLLAARTRRPAATIAIGAVVATVGSVVTARLVSDWLPRLEFGTDTRAAEVAVGVLLAVAVRSGRLTIPDPRRGDLLALGGLAAIGVVFAAYGTPATGLLRGGYALLAGASAATIAGLLAHGRIAAVLSSRWLVWIGTVSYSLYLVHWPIMLALTPDRVGVDGVALAAVLVAASTVVAAALSLLVEQPVRRARPTSTAPTVVAHVLGAAAVSALAWLVLA